MYDVSKTDNMRKSIFFIVVAFVLLLSSCRNEQRADATLFAAKEYYDSLLAGNYAYFMRGTYLPDTIPPSYREQLETNLRMFMARQEAEHHGIKAVSALSCSHDTTTTKDGKGSICTANAFLELTYGDSIKEEIVVPMIQHEGRWLMR